MFNMIKMDVYRMFKMKSLYVVWAIMLVFVIMPTWSVATMSEDSQAQTDEYQQTLDETYSDDDIIIGMQVITPTESGADISVFDMIFANMRAKLVALFVVIFVILFATADIGSGYIKNIGGQVRHREELVISKLISVFLYTVLTLMLFLFTQAASNRFFLGYLKWGNMDKLILYMGTQIVLHFTIAMIVMAIAILMRNNVISMIFAICLCMNVLVAIYFGIEFLIKKVGLGTVDIIKYTVSSKMQTLSMDLSVSNGVHAITLSLIYIGIATFVSILIYRKRDIC